MHGRVQPASHKGACSERSTRQGRVWGDGMSARCSGASFGRRRLARELRGWRHMISAVRVRGCATSPAENWTRFSSCWDTFRFRRRSGTSGANRSFDAPSTIASGLSRMRPCDRGARRADGPRNVRPSRLFVTSRGRSHRELAIPHIARVDIPRNQVLFHLSA